MDNKSFEKYDVLILGAGPAGMTASIYASRYRLSHVAIGKMPGGLMTEAHKVCNFPSEAEISGAELTNKMLQNATSQGSEIVSDEASLIEKDKGFFKVTTVNGMEYYGKKILAATGTEHRKLELEKEDEFLGKGVSYCATCDGMFYKGKTVAVIGGGNSANTASLYLSEVAEKVYQIYRRDKLKGDPSWIKKVLGAPNVEVVYNNKIVDLQGEDKLDRIVLENEHKGSKELELDGLFVEIGTKPKTDIYQNIGVEINDGGYIKVGSDQSTNVKGVWSAGDITDASNGFRQIVTACSEGAIAVNSIYINSKQL